MKGLTTSDFDRLTTHVPNFVGAYPHDVKPNPPPPYSIILNTDNHSKKGEHWVAIHITAKTLFFADSFGRPYTDQSFPRDFVRSITKLCRRRKVFYNRKLIQDLTSDCCGFYAVFILDRLALKQSKRSIFKVFTNDLIKNDQFVVRYYKNNFL